MAAAVGKVTVAFVAVEGMDQYFVSLTLDPGEPRVDLGTQVIGRRCSLPFGGETEGGRQVLISAHHGAPEVTFEVHSRGKFFGRGIITIQHVQIEEAIIVEVDEISAPGPSGLVHRHSWGLQTGDLLEFAAGLPVVKKIAIGSFNKHRVHSRNAASDAASSLTVHVRDVEVVTAV